MDLVHDIANIKEEEEEEEEEKEDNFRNVPNEIIDHICSYLDLKYAVQSSTLSRRWEHIGPSTRNLNLDCRNFPTFALFSKFVKQALSHRDHVEIEKVRLTFTGAATKSVVRSTIDYAYLRNVPELNVTWLTRKLFQFPEYLFSSQTLRHLTLATSDQSFYYQHKTSCMPKCEWNFPALETLFLSSMHFGDQGDESLDLVFSKCVNLKDLTLHKCCMYGLDTVNIYAPELLTLTIIHATAYPNVFNVAAPRLENLTASVKATVNRVPFIFESLRLSNEDLDSLKKVNLSFSMPHYAQKRFVPLLLDLFRKLCSTEFLVINLDIIKTLSLCLDELSHEPCPFKNLSGLKISTATLNERNRIDTMPDQVKNYFLENSPSATFIMDLPQVAHKRSREEVHDETVAKKVAKLKAKGKRPEVVTKKKRRNEASTSTAKLPLPTRHS